MKNDFDKEKEKTEQPKSYVSDYYEKKSNNDFVKNGVLNDTDNPLEMNLFLRNNQPLPLEILVLDGFTRNQKREKLEKLEFEKLKELESERLEKLEFEKMEKLEKEAFKKRTRPYYIP